MRKLFPALLLAAGTALAAMPAVAAPITSGVYDGLLVGVDKQGILTAYFESTTTTSAVQTPKKAEITCQWRI